MKIQVVNHARRDIEVHAPGCADIEREKRKLLVNSDWPLEIPEGKTIEQAVADDLNESFGWPYSDGNGGVTDEPAPWSETHVRVMPCCKKLK